MSVTAVRLRTLGVSFVFLALLSLTYAGQVASAPSVPAPSLPLLSVEQVFNKSAPAIVLITLVNGTGRTLSLGSGFVAAPSGVIVTNHLYTLIVTS